MTRTISRVPLRPRQVNVENRLSSSSTKSSFLIRKDSKPSYERQNSLPSVESSNNENNKAYTSMSSESLRYAFNSHGSNIDLSTVADAGQGTKDAVKKSSVSSQLNFTKKSSTSKTKETTGTDPVTIVEHRKRPSGDGHTVHKYLRGKLLGKGGFAKVYKVTSLDTGKEYAVKIVPKANLIKARARQKLQTEIKIHRTMKHANICEYKHFFEDKINCYILLELCHNQTINEMIKRRKTLTEEEARFFMLQLTEAVSFMHDSNVIHRDLKLGNLFLNKHLSIKVGDFGLATRVDSSDEKRKTICGTPNYIAPEVIDGNKEKRGHSFEVDVWSMGVICFTMLVGKPPYEANDVKSTYRRILANEYSFPQGMVSSDARTLIRSMLQTDPGKRPSLDEIRSHPFFTCSKIPNSLPHSCTVSAPTWAIDEFGELYPAKPRSALDLNYSKLTMNRQPLGLKLSENITTTSTSEKCLEKHTSSYINKSKQPYLKDFKDESLPSVDSSKQSSTKQPLRTKLSNKTMSSVQQNGNLKPGPFNSKSCLTSKNQPEGNKARKGPLKAAGTPALKFDIYNDIGDEERNHMYQLPSQSTVVAKNHSAILEQHTDDQVAMKSLTDKVADCCIDEAREMPPDTSIPVTTTSTTVLAVAGLSPAIELSMNEAQALQPVRQLSPSHDLTELDAMHTRLKELADYCSRIKDGETNVTLPQISPLKGSEMWGPTKWVARHVDYTSKYGLGFLLNDGSSGVYFNDSTKAVLSSVNENFLYIERRKVKADGTKEPIVKYTLSDYPEDTLKKKVTLLKHFRGYLSEQQRRAEEAGETGPLSSNFDEQQDISESPMVYMKKWIRTKYAMLFRLSNGVVQVVFHDLSEILLSSEGKIVTFVDKEKNRYVLTIADVAKNQTPDIMRRLKYANEILFQLISGSKR